MSKRNLLGFVVGGALLAFAPGALAQAGAVSLSTGFTPDPVTLSGVSGGPVSAQGVDGSCRGYIPATPNHILLTSTGFRFLRVFAQSMGDTTLMVRGVNGTWCADDTYGLNPGVDLALPPGRYDIYVGSYSAGAQSPYTLSITELQSVTPSSGGGTTGPVPPVHSPPATGPLNFSLPPRLGSFVMSNRPGFARRINGRTAGELAATGIRGQGICRGYVNAEPTVAFTLDHPEPFLRTFVTSAADTTLMVMTPDGSILCSDDAYGLHPSIDGRAAPGTYYVWVGIYRPGVVRPFRLTVTRNPNLHP